MIITKFAAATVIATLAGAAVVAVPAASSANETTTYTYQGPPVAVPDGNPLTFAEFFHADTGYAGRVACTDAV